MKALLIQEVGLDTALSRALAESGCEWSGVCGAELARDRLASARFDLVIVDLSEPSAAEAFCRWLAAPAHRSNQFILAGADPEPKERVSDLLGAGADDVVLRPYQPAAVRARLMAVQHEIHQRSEWQMKMEALNTVAQQQVALAALGHCALSEELPNVLEAAGWSIIYTLQVDLWVLLEVCDSDQLLKATAGFGWREDCLGRVFPRPSDESLTGRGLRCEDARVVDLRQDGAPPVLDFVRDHGAVSGVSVGVKGKEKSVYGVLEVYARQPRVITEDELHFLRGVANVLGAAIEQKRVEVESQKYQAQVQHLQRLESIGQLAAGLAHDYNNVLTVIHGHVTLALGSPRLGAKTARSLKLVLEAVEHAANLTRQMLTFSRKQGMEPRPVDLNAVVGSMARLLDRVLGQNIRLELQPGTGLPTIQADCGMLDQVIMNLAVNARDAMPGGGSLRIGTSRVSLDTGQARRHAGARPGEFVCLSVSDTGCGMDEETQHRIFDPFFTTKQPGKGTGLGLSTVYGIVKQHQGWIEVRSEPGHGATFEVFFPSLDQPRSAPVAETTEPAPTGGHETILVVEDEPTLRELARLLLENLGYRVLEAGSGQEALEVWNQNQGKVDLVLTDLVMPDGVTGFELAERLQRSWPDLKVLLTSGYSADEVRGKLPRRQNFQFVQKPYHSESLGRAIRACLESKPTLVPATPARVERAT